MKFILIIVLIYISLAKAILIPFQKMTDLEVAKYVANSLDDENSYGDIIYPTVGEVWHVGDLVNVTFTPSTFNQTVAIFFFDQTKILAGGPLDKPSVTFGFVVPMEALSPENSTSLLLAVRRENYYLQTVDSIALRVLGPRV